MSKLSSDELKSISAGNDTLDAIGDFIGDVVGTVVGGTACMLKCLSNKLGITSPKAN